MDITTIEWLPLLASWLSPGYPVGAFSYSHGLEWAVEAGEVRDRATLEAYVATVIECGGGWSDLVLLAEAWRAAAGDDSATLDEVADYAMALRGTTEMALESAQQGAAFVAVTRAAWPGTKLDALADRVGAERIAYPVAVGAACAGIVPLPAVLLAFGHAVASNLVSAGVRLVPLGQTDGQRTVAALAPVIAAAARAAERTTLAELGTAAPRIEIASMRHETQYTRLFRS